MPFYTGSSADGSDMREVEGMYLHPNGKEFSNMPYHKTKEDRLYEKCYDHIAANKRTFQDEYDLIKQKKSALSSACRTYFVAEFEKHNKLPITE